MELPRRTLAGEGRGGRGTRLPNVPSTKNDGKRRRLSTVLLVDLHFSRRCTRLNGEPATRKQTATFLPADACFSTVENGSARGCGGGGPT